MKGEEIRRGYEEEKIRRGYGSGGVMKGEEIRRDYGNKGL